MFHVKHRTLVPVYRSWVTATHCNRFARASTYHHSRRPLDGRADFTHRNEPYFSILGREATASGELPVPLDTYNISKISRPVKNVDFTGFFEGGLLDSFEGQGGEGHTLTR